MMDGWYSLRQETINGLRVSGEDSETFIQSQFSNDICPPQRTPATYGFWLNRKGKVDADSFVIREADRQFLIYSYFCSMHNLQQRLEAHVIADDVHIGSIANDYSALILWTADPHVSRPQALSANSQLSPGQAHYQHGYLFPSHLPQQGSYTVLGKRQEIDSLQSILISQGLTIVSEKELHQTRISSGIPAIPQDINATMLPQEGALQDYGVCFTKGCYLGQEVMARLNAMGKVQRHLYQVSMPGDYQVPINLFSQEKIVGKISSAVTLNNQTLGLALIKAKTAMGTESITGEQGQAIRIIKRIGTP